MNKYKKQAAFIPLRQRLPTSLKFRRTGHNKTGFTIVELLVVIVVIAILAAITVVSYTGISNKASLASLQSDLTNASNTLKLYQVDNMAYPTNIADCPTPSSTTKICLKLSPGNTPTYEYNNDTSPQTYNLKLTNSTAGTGVITNNSKPIIPTPAPLSPVADWLAIPTGEHYGNFYDSVTKGWATVTRTTPKTIYDPSTNHIYDVPAGYLAVNPRSDGKSGSEAVIEEARSNYLLNSYWNSGSAPGTNWSLSGTITGTPTQTISASSLYGNAYRFIYTGAAGDSSAYEMLIQSTPAASFASGDTATASFWFKG